MHNIRVTGLVCVFLGLLAIIAYGFEETRKVNILTWQLEEQKSIASRCEQK